MNFQNENDLNEYTSQLVGSIIFIAKKRVESIIDSNPYFKKGIEYPDNDRNDIIVEVKRELIIRYDDWFQIWRGQSLRDGSLAVRQTCGFKTAVYDYFKEKCTKLQSNEIEFDALLRFLETKLPIWRDRYIKNVDLMPIDDRDTYECDYHFIARISKEQLVQFCIKLHTLLEVRNTRKYDERLGLLWWQGSEPIDQPIDIPPPMKEILQSQNDWNLIFNFIKDEMKLTDSTLRYTGNSKADQGQMLDFIDFFKDQAFYKNGKDWSDISKAWTETFTGLEIKSGKDAFNGDTRYRMSPDKRRRINKKYEEHSWYSKAVKTFPKK